MSCNYYQNGTCRVTSELSGLTTPTDEQVCKACSESPYPQRINTVTLSRACWWLRKNGQEVSKELQEAALGHRYGTGTELKKIIDWLPWKPVQCRKCRNLEYRMNVWGPDKCVEKKPYIIKKLLIAAIRHKIPTTYWIVETAVDRAIQSSRAEIR